MAMGIGTKRITASGLVDSTNAINIYSVETIATSGGATVVTVKDGGSGGNAVIQLDAATSKSDYKDFSRGLMCATAGGAYVTVDTNTSYVMVCYERVV